MPDFKAYVRQNLAPLGMPGMREAEITEELALEFQERYDRALRSGLSAEEAWQEVITHARPWEELRRELNSALDEPPLVEPPRKTSFVGRFWQDSGRDLRYAARQLMKSPGFTVIAVLTLALGIGANTAIFSLLNAILLRELPVRQPAQLLLFGPSQAEGSTGFLPHDSALAYSYPFYRDFRQKNQVFSDVAAVQSFLVNSHGRVAGSPSLEKMSVELVSGTYFDTLGVNAIQGRVFSPADDQTPGGHPVAIANYYWWQRRLDKDPTAVGKTITIGQTVYTLIGVAPRGFFGVTVGNSPDFWIPLAMEKEISPDENGLADNFFQSLHMIGRLKPGVSQAQAQVQTNVLFRQLLRSYLGQQPSEAELRSIQAARIDLTPAATGRSRLRKEFSSPLKILMAVVALVLLIACANVANLQLARATARQREIAVRMSMGAERWRLIRQLLAESSLLGLVGAALGIVFAWSASQLLLAMVSTGSQVVPLRVSPDPGVLAFTAGVTILTVLLFGTAPAFQATRLELASTLKESRGVISSASRNRLSRGLVVGQVALSLVLLAGAGLFLRSLANLMDMNVGFDKHNALRVHIDPSAAGYHTDARLRSVMQRIEERVSGLPGIESASFALSVFDGGGWSTSEVTAHGRSSKEERPGVDLNIVGPDYFKVMRMPVVQGRGLNLHDNAASRKVAVINETMVRTHFGGTSPLGRTFEVGDEPELQNVEVVGVVKDAKYMDLEEKQKPAAFFPHAQLDRRYLNSFVVRYTGDPGLVVPTIRRGVAEIDPNLPVSDVATLVQMVDESVLNKRLVAQLSTFFGVLAALLACIGIYGVMSYGIARRTNEFGIRMALGADRGNVLWVVLRETLLLAAAGVVIGLALTLASSRLVESLLFGLKPDDPLAIGVAIAAMIVVALLAGYIPARRATRIDPMVALRYE